MTVLDIFLTIMLMGFIWLTVICISKHKNSKDVPAFLTAVVIVGWIMIAIFSIPFFIMTINWDYQVFEL